MSFLLPAVCSTFKGVSPSAFAERWGDAQFGKARMEMDASIASEINERINEMHNNSSGSKEGIADRAKGAVARRDQRRAQRRG